MKPGGAKCELAHTGSAGSANLWDGDCATLGERVGMSGAWCSSPLIGQACLLGVGLQLGALFVATGAAPGETADLVFATPPQSLSERATDTLIETRLLLDERHHILGRIAKRLAAHAAHPCRVARVRISIRDESHSLYQAAHVERL